MHTSERITWTACPVCSEQAAVGWAESRPVEFDCVNGCGVTVDQVQGSADGAPDASRLAGGG